VLFFGTLVGASAVVYIPMALACNPFRWTEFGPFFFQTSRILHYLIYFLIAVGVGAYGLERGLLFRDGKLARRWLLWSVVALLVFGVTTAVAIVAMTAKSSAYAWEAVGSLAFCVSCAASSFAFLALFLRFARTPRPILDSLRDNAYGMYLIHYACVSWLQYAVLKVELTAPVKGLTVFVGTLAVSWSVTAALRRIPIMALIL
jgi:surface polysaccharide O-acyltransferase-like enzyme